MPATVLLEFRPVKIAIVKHRRSVDDAAFAGASVNAVQVAAGEVGHFLADSSSDISVLPLSFSQSTTNPNYCGANPDGIHYEAANGTSLKYNRNITLTFQIPQLDQEFTWNFIIAGVSQPILGFHFLNRHGLAVDCLNMCLIRMKKVEKSSRKQRIAKQAKILACRHISGSSSSYVSRLKEKYKELFGPFSGFAAVKHPVEHKIETHGQPCFARPRRLFGEKLKIAKDEFRKWEEKGIIYRGESPWATPLHLAPKRGRQNEWRPCGDYRQLNVQTLPDRYPMPNINDMTNSYHGCCVFSKLDLVSAYLQIPVATEDQQKTAITTPFGLFIFRRIPFGLRNASQTFQRLLNMVLKDCPFAQAYIDDIIIGSPDPAVHQEHLEQVMQQLTEYGLRLRPDKCSFFQEKVNFVGMEVSKAGSHSRGRVKVLPTFMCA